MEKTNKRSECPLSCSLDIFGDKWSLLIIRDMMFFNKSTYGDFLKSEEGIATNILAARLQNLEENELIKKTEHPTSKAKVLYQLTNKAIELLPILVEIQLWAEKYFEIPTEIKTQLKEVKKGKEEFIKVMTKKLKKQIVGQT
ncbi:helix-turn-helix transcriptional regulator [Leptospira bandrabouensis]|uniref:winged helix-turn-helix transcriptional regulator n=1 Tax=Leptospira bandrabouensis TaxID=2484903 RepID=UPI00223D0CE9|nr:helix-turn-helix domain-containing protein [Leptospira bandrabouensis]MCW7457552.1 helix-turn-helix transcriptional regulator [Leptospira bandrabouensis]MCW7476172.1 helix-turn-helix transcriptional regulator [Leptospira bandrabouensis]MCW7483854.1 helix-turn-helix transcriptional regulator [Leptospira bandrabouensis]